MLVEFLHEIMKQHTSLSVIDLSPLHNTIQFSVPEQDVLFYFRMGRYKGGNITQNDNVQFTKP